MKNLLFTLTFVFSIFGLLAQKDQLLEFQKQHPEIAFISQEHFNTFSYEEIKILGNNYIIFNQKIESSDISSFLESKLPNKNLTEKSNRIEKSAEEDNLIKIWISHHGYVKIVKQSEYLGLSYEDKLVYTNNHCMILIGETITLLDINQYPY